MEGAAGVRVAALLALLALAACGRPGDIRPPGPPEQVTFPRVYPSR
jgi:predicted small lipoprotein YifL